MNQPIFSRHFKISLVFLWISHFFMDFFTGIWPIYKTIAEIDIAIAGLIAGVCGFFGDSLQIFFGYLCDRDKRKNVMIFGLLVSCGILAVTFFDQIWQLFAIMLLLTIGSGSFHPAAAGTAGSLSKEHKGKVILFFASGGVLGLGISQLTFTSLLKHMNGHAVVLLLPVALVLLGLCLFRFPAHSSPSKQVTLRGFFEPLAAHKKSLAFLYLTQVTSYAVSLSFTFVLPDLLLVKQCHSWLCMGGGHLCFMVGCALTLIPAGYLCDKYGQKNVLLIVLLLALFALYVFLNHSSLSLGWNILLLIIVGGFLGIINPIIVSWGHRLVPESPSTVSGLLMGFAWCLSNFGPTFTGYLAKQFGSDPYLNAMSIVGLLLSLSFFLILVMPQPKMLKIPALVSSTEKEPS